MQEIITTTHGPPETLHALNALRRAMSAEVVGDDKCERFYMFQKSLLVDLTKTKKSKDISFFSLQVKHSFTAPFNEKFVSFE